MSDKGLKIFIYLLLLHLLHINGVAKHAIGIYEIELFKLKKRELLNSCNQQKQTVIAAPKDTGYVYEWYRNSILLSSTSDTLLISEPGDYWAVIVLSSARKLYSDTIAIQQFYNTDVNVAMEPILPVCGNDETPIHLIGSPAGGTFQGPGVVGDTFNPKEAGVGVHELTYSISSTAPCPGAVAKQTVEVYNWPEFNISEEICVTHGTGSKIGIKESAGWRYEWFPQEGLDKPSVSMPIVTTDADRLYTLTVTNAEGCNTERQIQVKICSKLSIPNAFTPNQDGINDLWELRGIDHFPDAEITIFNRWGNVIFHSKGYANPFDGAENQAGVYHYKIKLNDALPLKSGPLMLIR